MKMETTISFKIFEISFESYKKIDHEKKNNLALLIFVERWKTQSTAESENQVYISISYSKYDAFEKHTRIAQYFLYL